MSSRLSVSLLRSLGLIFLPLTLGRVSIKAYLQRGGLWYADLCKCPNVGERRPGEQQEARLSRFLREVYRSDVLEQDLTLAGPIQVDLSVSTSGTDCDWVVKLVDVYPDDYPDPNPNPTGVHLGGYQQLVRGDVMRGKFRNSFEKPEPFVPDQPTAVKFTLPDVCHSFRAGHRVMVQVQSTWFPLIDRNPQTFVDIYTAQEADFRKSTQRVYRSADLRSCLVVPVLPGG